MNISPARIAAFEILSKIETDKSFSSVLLPIYEENLSEKDRGLCHELTLGVLRQKIYLDRIIENFTQGKKNDREIKTILQIGLYQLLFLNKIPAHAAINDAVNLAQKAKKTSAKGFVNAVLRKATREIIELEFVDEIEKLSVETSHPRWLAEHWIQQFGFETTEKICRANNETPPTDYRFTAKTSEAVKNSLQKGNIENEKNYLRELADNGKIYFQDKASQMVAKAVDLQADESFLDVCCAPGSKFSLVNYLVQEPKKIFVGGDLYFQRLKTVRNSCEKTAVKNYHLTVYNAEKSLPFADKSFDVVLLDAPCTGTGTIRHNPEIRYFLDEKDFLELSVKQLAILRNASNVVKRGGRLIYSTCSLERAENEDVINNFLAGNENFETVQIKLPPQFLCAGDFARTFPHRDGTDGFFIAVLEKQ